MRFIDWVLAPFRLLAVLLFFSYGLSYCSFGLEGVEHQFGGWGLLIAVVLLVCGFTLPLMIGFYIALTQLYGFEWYIAVLLCAPGIALLLPILLKEWVSSLLHRTKDRFSRFPD